MTRPPKVRTPALDAWRRELAAGRRTARTFDVLRAAAGWEQSALDAVAVGLDEAAARDFTVATTLVRKAVAA